MYYNMLLNRVIYRNGKLVYLTNLSPTLNLTIKSEDDGTEVELPISLIDRPTYYTSRSPYPPYPPYEEKKRSYFMDGYDDDVNSDRDLQKSVSRHFYDKFKNTWLKDSFNELLRYFVMRDDGISFIKSLDHMDKVTNHVNEKISFICNHVISKLDIHSMVEKYVRKHNVNWFDLKTKWKSEIKHHIYNKSKKIIVKKIRNW